MDEEIDSGVVVLHHDRGELKMHDSRLRALDSTARDPERRLPWSPTPWSSRVPTGPNSRSEGALAPVVPVVEEGALAPVVPVVEEGALAPVSKPPISGLSAAAVSSNACSIAWSPRPRCSASRDPLGAATIATWVTALAGTDRVVDDAERIDQIRVLEELKAAASAAQARATADLDDSVRRGHAEARIPAARQARAWPPRLPWPAA